MSITTKHECDDMKAAWRGHWGAAIDEIFYEDKQGWLAMAGINEFYSQITFCPFCGVKL